MLNRELDRPLDRAEVGVLREFLAATPNAMPFPRAHGFLTAIASAPTTILPSDWQSLLLGDPAFTSREHAERVIGLVMRLYNQILTDLAEGHPLPPPMLDRDDTIGVWCAGYAEAARMDDVWMGDERGALFLFPFVVLAGEGDLVGEEDADGNIIEDPTPQLRRCRETLAATVREANRYWTAQRRKNMMNMADSAAPRPPKVGRNEPCPCGSGLKFKKCCALTAS